MLLKDAMIDETIEEAKKQEDEKAQIDDETNKILKTVYYTQPYNIQRAIIYYLMGLRQEDAGKIVGVSQSYLSRVFRKKIRAIASSEEIQKKNKNIEFEMYLNGKIAKLYVSDRIKNQMSDNLKKAKYVGRENNYNIYEIKRTKNIYAQAQNFLIKLQEDKAKEQIK